MRFLRKAAVAASMSTSLISLIVSAPQAAAQTEQAHTYRLPAQSLSASLRAVAMATGKTIGGDARLLAGRQAPALNGSFNPESAVAALLAGSGLHGRSIGTGMIIEADAGGSEEGEKGSEIVVTGSRIRGAPIASAVIVVDHATMAESGKTGLGDVMRDLPQNFGGGQNPGIGTNVPTASGINIGGASSVNLRGLGSDATLTLLNGHRIAYNGSRQGIDVSALPIGIVERVEVVADGASALYGSDAVAGVANIILRRDYQGLEVSANLGGATAGGDFQQQYGLVTGRRWSGGGLVAAYEFSQNSQINSNDRSFAAVRPGVILYPAMHRHAAALAAHQALTDNLTFEVDATYNKRWSYRGYALNAAGDWAVSHQDQTTASRSGAIAPSLKLDLPHGWRASLSGVYGTETVTFYNGAFTGSTLSASNAGCYCNDGKSIELAGDGRLFNLPAGAVKLAIGTGYRINSMNFFTGQGAASNINASESSTYAYGEVSVPVVSPAQQITAINNLNLSGAVRYERYPGIGSVATPKFGIIYAPVEDLSIKGSWGRSFKAPTLYQRYSAQLLLAYPTASLGGTGYPATSSVLYLSGGSTTLKPERAESWAVTAEYRPHQLPGLRLEASYFSTIYRDRIVAPITYFSQALSNPLYASYVKLAPSAADIASVMANAAGFYNYTNGTYDPSQVMGIVNGSSVNAGRQVIDGVDMLVDYKTKLGSDGGTLSLSGNAAYLVGRQQLTPGAAVTQLAGTLFNPPHWRGRGSVTWSRQGLTVNATTSLIGGVTDARATVPVRVAGMVTQDFTLRYAFQQPAGLLHGLAFSLTAQNLFNSVPTTIATTYYADTAYDSTNYSPVGRYIGMGITKSW